MSKKKNNKNVYQRGKVSTVHQSTRDKSKDKIYAIILCVFIVFWTVASVLGSIGFFRTSAEEIEVVPSNTITDDGWIIELEGISGTRLYNQGYLDGAIGGVYTLEFQRQTDYLILKHTSSSEIFTTQWTIGDNTQSKPFSLSVFSGDETFIETVDVNINGSLDFIYTAIPFKAVYFSIDNSRPFRVEIDFVDEVGNLVGTLPIIQWTDFEYVTVTEYQCSFDYRNFFDIGNNDFFSQEIKFLPYNAVNDYIAGYEEGKNVGYNDGYSIGYNNGVEESNVYSFTNLIGATLDGQVNMFMGLFNFELFGVNLSSFFLALLTVCVIITIIKLLM